MNAASQKECMDNANRRAAEKARAKGWLVDDDLPCTYSHAIRHGAWHIAGGGPVPGGADETGDLLFRNDAVFWAWCNSL